MKTLKHKAISSRIKKATGCDVLAEDRVYIMRPLSWYLKKPWYGMEPLSYLGDAFDCDDFCDVLKVDLVKRNLKGLGNYQDGESFPAVPAFKTKVDIGESSPHWVMLICTTDGEYFIERTKGSIKMVDGIRRFYRVLG